MKKSNLVFALILCALVASKSYADSTYFKPGESGFSLEGDYLKSGEVSHATDVLGDFSWKGLVDVMVGLGGTNSSVSGFDFDYKFVRYGLVVTPIRQGEVYPVSLGVGVGYQSFNSFSGDISSVSGLSLTGYATSFGVKATREIALSKGRALVSLGLSNATSVLETDYLGSNSNGVTNYTSLDSSATYLIDLSDRIDLGVGVAGSTTSALPFTYGVGIGLVYHL